MLSPSWLATSPHQALLESLRQVAWADGDLSTSERLMIAALVRRLGLTPSDEELRGWLGETPDLATPIPPIEGSFERRYLLSQAIRIAYEDGDYSTEEEERIQTWASGWGISAEEVAGLESDYLQEKANSDPFQS